MKPRFNLDNYRDGYVVMNCKNRDEIYVFCEFFDSNDRVFVDGQKYDAEGRVLRDYKEVCFRFNRGMIASRSYYACYGRFTILEFEDFDWDEDEGEFPEEDAIDNFYSLFTGGNS